MEICSPSGPLAVEMTSYSKERAKSSPDQQDRGILLLTQRRQIKRLQNKN